MERQNAAELLFLNCCVQRSRNASFSYYNVNAFPKNCCSTSCLPLDIKDSLKEDMRFFNGRGFLMAD
jgi:hypothetical protein